MKISEWAKREIDIYTKINGSDDYTLAVLNSALKSFVSLCDDGHSGMSIGMTKVILDRLIDTKPLTPLTGNDDEWSNITDPHENYICYQSNRSTSVFKKVYNDGRVSYNDVDRFVVEDINTGYTWTGGMATCVAVEVYPEITMPYMPGSMNARIYVEEFLFNLEGGDYDTLAVLYGKDERGNITRINRFFKEDLNSDPRWVEITKDEYLTRRINRVDKESFDIKDTDDNFDKIQQTILQDLDKEKIGDLSDGYHTYNELYYHRMKLFSIICNTYGDKAWKSWKHDDGSMYDGMFIVGVSTPRGDYSYHYHSEHWDAFNIKELDYAPVWDGHKPSDIGRLDSLL